MAKNLKKLIDSITTDLDKTVTSAKKLNTKSFSSKTIRGVLDIVEMVVSAVEEKQLTVKGLTGKDKKDLAVAILNKYINIDIPYVPKRLEDKIEGIVIRLVIDLVVNFLNKKFGKKWLKDQ